MCIHDTVPSSLLAASPQDVSRLVVSKGGHPSDDPEVVAFLSLGRLDRMRELIVSAAAMAEKHNFDVIPVFREKWERVKQVLGEPAQVTLRVLICLEEAAEQTLREFCRWYNAWTVPMHRALGQP